MIGKWRGLPWGLGSWFWMVFTTSKIEQGMNRCYTAQSAIQRGWFGIALNRDWQQKYQYCQMQSKIITFLKFGTRSSNNQGYDIWYIYIYNYDITYADIYTLYLSMILNWLRIILGILGQVPEPRQWNSNTCRRLAQRCSDFERQLGDDAFVEMLEEDGSVPESGLN